MDNIRGKRYPPTFLLLLIPSIILMIGSFIHYQRGYYGAGLAAIHAQGVDDAYITYRYGWNLTHFGRLSWNESGYRSTEGFTNPLWVLASAAWALPGVKEWVYPMSVLTSVILSALLLYYLTKQVYEKNNGSTISIMGVIAVAAIPAMWLHTTSGLESAVFGLCLAVLAYLVLFSNELDAKPVLVVGLTIFTGLLRSDGFVYLGIILIAGVVSKSYVWRYLAFGLFISVVLLFSWRLLTYGTLLPNTAQAKVNFSLLERISGGLNFFTFALLNSGLLIVLLFGFGGLWLEERRAGLAGVFIILSWLAYYIYIGSDWGFERHLVGIFFLCAAFSAKLWLVAKPTTRFLYYVVFAVVIVLAVFRFENRFNYLTVKAKDPWVMLGQAVSENRDYYGVLVTRAAGKIPFYAGGEIIDALGLNDPYLATLQRDIFAPGHSAGNDLAAIELAASHEFGRYSLFTYLDDQFVTSPEDISLWVDNQNPQDNVHIGANEQQWSAAMARDDFLVWSIITEPVFSW